MTRLNIAFDIDGCFVDLMAQFKTHLDQHGIAIVDNGKFHIETKPALSVDQLWDVFIECYGEYDTIPIYPGAAELCDILHGISGCPVQFVTGRHSAAATHTHLMVERFCDVPYTISFVGHHDRSKLGFLNGHKYFVEDRRKTAREIAMTGRTVYVPDRPWNKMEYMPGIVRVSGIIDLIPHVEEFITTK